MTLTLNRTLTQVRDSAVAHLGTLGIPNAWWPSLYDRPWDENNDCIKFVLYTMGVCTREQQDNHFTSIAGFLAWSGWNTVSPDEIRPGDIALWNFDGGATFEHAELTYAVPVAKITTVSANTTPYPGAPFTEKTRGVYKKTRTVTSELRAGIRPPYVSPATTSAARKRARVTGTWLNKHLPAGCQPSAVGDIGKQAGDGITDPAPIYWGNVQTWGSQHDQHGNPVPRGRAVYGPTFDIDRIPGNRSRAVESIIHGLATKKLGR
jgi:hypothetical protein